MTQIFSFSINIPAECRNQIRTELAITPRLDYGDVDLSQHLFLSGWIRKLVFKAGNLPPILFSDTLLIRICSLDLRNDGEAVCFTVKYLHCAEDGTEAICLKLEVDAGLNELGLISFDRRSMRPQHLSAGPNGEVLGAVALDVPPIAKDALIRAIPPEEGMVSFRSWDDRLARYVTKILAPPTSYLDNFSGTWNHLSQNGGSNEQVSIPRTPAASADIDAGDLAPSSVQDDLRLAEFLVSLPIPLPFRPENSELNTDDRSETQARLQARLADQARDFGCRQDFTSLLGIRLDDSPYGGGEHIDIRQHPSRFRGFDFDSPLTDREISSFREFFQQEALRSGFRSDSSQGVPTACIGCADYHGKSYGGNKLICGIHPHGVEAGTVCADYVSEVTDNV